jgi:hypothetical protein
MNWQEMLRHAIIKITPEYYGKIVQNRVSIEIKKIVEMIK